MDYPEGTIATWQSKDGKQLAALRRADGWYLAPVARMASNATDEWIGSQRSALFITPVAMDWQHHYESAMSMMAAHRERFANLRESLMLERDAAEIHRNQAERSEQVALQAARDIERNLQAEITKLKAEINQLKARPTEVSVEETVRKMVNALLGQDKV